MNAFPRITCSALFALVGAAALPAQEGMPASSTLQVEFEASKMLDKIGALVDGRLEFTDERGYPLKLQQFFPGNRPVILDLGYYGCPGLCGQVMNGMVDALNEIDLEPGQDYEILTVSIDPREQPELAKQKKDSFLVKFTKVDAATGWHFAVGGADAIKTLTDAVGFRYYWDEHNSRFDHPPALILLSPEGRVTRVLIGSSYDPRDLRLALIEASQGKLGTFLDKVVLSCLTFDPQKRTYSLTAMTVMKIGAVITLLVLGIMITVMLRREKKREAAAATA